jgi:hypothetical protein
VRCRDIDPKQPYRFVLLNTPLVIWRDPNTNSWQVGYAAGAPRASARPARPSNRALVTRADRAAASRPDPNGSTSG